MGWQNDEAAVNAEHISGGIGIRWDLWGRKHDNAGIGFACFCGGNQYPDNARVVEGYMRFALGDLVAFTLDIQYMKDTYKAGLNPSGLICGIRLTAHF